MQDEIKVATATPELIAAVRARVARGGVAQAFGSALDKVWTYLRQHPGLRTEGHNLFLYHHEGMESGFMTVDFGVQVVRRFEPEQDVRCIETPGGEVVTAIHRGAYPALPRTHGAIHEWCRRNGRPIGACSWEIYGDWTDDPRQLETTVVYALSSSGRLTSG
jgi:effector-binding domain-containing protein